MKPDKNITYYFILITYSLLLTIGCSKKYHTLQQSERTTIRERVIDTIIKGDTLYETVYIECPDLINNEELIINKLDKKESPIKYSLNGNKMSLQANCPDKQVFIRVRDTIRLTEVREKIIREPRAVHNFWYYLKLIGWHLLFVPAVIWGYRVIKN